MPTNTTIPGTHRFAALVAGLCLALTGCATGDPADRSDMSLQEQYDQVAQRPDREQAIAAYEQLQEQVRSTLSDRFDLPGWDTGSSEERGVANCSEFPDLIGWDAGRLTMQNWVTSGAISVYDWPEAKETLRELTRDHGFDTVTLEIDNRENLTYELTNDTGAKITLMSGGPANTVLSMRTGCHLEPAAKDRGRPISQEERREMDEEESEQYRDQVRE